MARSIEIDADQPTAQQDIVLYRGERLEIRPRADLGPARLVLAISARAGGAPLLQIEGGGAVIATRARLEALGEGESHAYNLWLARGADLTLLRHGRFEQRAAIEPVAAEGPVNLAQPVITGTREVGARLDLAHGDWAGAESLDVAWRRDGVAIAGAGETSYVVAPEDEGRWIDARVTATNAQGAVTLPAHGAGPVAWPAPRVTPPAPLRLVPGQAVDLDLAARVTGQGMRFALDPEGATLPEGLELSFDGRIIGTARGLAAARICTVAVENSGGGARIDLDIAVEAARPTPLLARGLSPRLIVLGDEVMAARPGARDMIAAGLGDKLCFAEGWMRAAAGMSAAAVRDALPETLALVRPGETVVLVGPLGAQRAPGSETAQEVGAQIAEIYDALLAAGAVVVAIPLLPEETGEGRDARNDAIAARSRDHAGGPDYHVVDIGARESAGPHAGGFDPARSFDPYTMKTGPVMPSLARGAPFLAARVIETIRGLVTGGLLPAVETAQNRLGAAWDFGGAVSLDQLEGLSGQGPEGWSLARTSGSATWQMGRDAAGDLEIVLEDSPDAGALEITAPLADLGWAKGELHDLLVGAEVIEAENYAGIGLALDGVAAGPVVFGAGAGTPGHPLMLRCETRALAAPRDTATARITIGAVAGSALRLALRRATVALRGVQAAPLTITGDPPAAVVGVDYAFAPRREGGTPPHRFDLAAGALPAGLALDETTGALSGRPEAAGRHPGLEIRVRDAAGAEAILGPLAIEVAPALERPANLFTPAQSGFDAAAHLDGRGNWQVAEGRLACNGAAPGNDARLTLDAPLVAGRAYVARIDHAHQAGTLKLQLGGDGVLSGRALSEGWQDTEYFPGAEVAGNYLRLQAKPSSDYAGSFDAVTLHDLSGVDPARVACDVVIIGGDSNATSATSEHVTPANRETGFDPRIWTMPGLRSGGSHSPSQSERHRPMPMVEPVIAAVGAQRMSPCHAAASELVARAAARGRPLLVMALGDAGSGLMNTEDWRRSSSVATTGARMWGEMLAMKAALEALGPAHEITGAIWSLGANDTFGGDYAVEEGWLDQMAGFVADLRAHVADVPMVLWRVGRHYEPDLGNGATDGRGQAMGAAQERLDQDSGDARAIARFKVVTPPEGHQLSDPHDPHYTAAGMQAKGRAAGAALAGLQAAEDQVT